MVGRLSLQDVPELVDTKKKGDGVLDSPDSGLPPSPSPSHWGLAAATGGGGERAPVAGTLEPDATVTSVVPNPASLSHSLAAICSPRLCPLSFGEGVEFDPLPPKEIKSHASLYPTPSHQGVMILSLVVTLGKSSGNDLTQDYQGQRVMETFQQRAVFLGEGILLLVYLLSQVRL
ncbi:refilin-B isoform X2 [Rattus rattus]|uniref:refilin-B isoform X2 n=1 Tax=Rattus rattus TaxID=10117 RepID=UPI0013F338C2|nr:refilin-B isoform X2 [Rattus rattus]